jgi:poly-gamma-glutamate synthesis protein (capsule biosynthesis protein)
VIVTGDASFESSKAGASGTPLEPDPLQDMKPVLDTAQVRIVSLASPLVVLAAKGMRAGASGPPGAAELLSRAGVDAIAVTDERLWSAGAKGFAETRQHLDDAGLPVAGVKTTEATVEPAQIFVDGWSVALFAASAVWPREPSAARAARERLVAADDPALATAVRATRSASDLIFVVYHGRADLSEEPDPEQRKFAAAMIDAGADAVFAEHARVPLGIEWTKGRPVFHGLGTFMGPEVPNQPWSQRGYLARLSYSKSAPPEVEACPFVIENGDPHRLRGATRANQEGIFRRHLQRLVDGVGSASVAESSRYACMRITPAAP